LQVEQEHIRSQASYGFNGLSTAGSLSHYKEFGLFVEKLAQALSENGVIVNE
jgi:hypothetical protein